MQHPSVSRHTKHFNNLVKVLHLGTALDEVANRFVGALDGLGNLVHILRLDDGLEVVLQHLGEVVCLTSLYVPKPHIQDLTLQLGTTEVLQNLLPIRRVVVAAKIGLELAAQDLQRRALADSVCSNQSQHLSRTGHGQSMQLEAVRRVSVRDLGLEVRGQVDDVDCVERALLGADTAAYAQALGDEGDFGLIRHFDAQLARADDGTRLFAFLPAFLRDVSRAPVDFGLGGTYLWLTLSPRTPILAPNFRELRGSEGERAHFVAGHNGNPAQVSKSKYTQGQTNTPSQFVGHGGQVCCGLTCLGPWRNNAKGGVSRKSGQTDETNWTSWESSSKLASDVQV